MKTSRISRRTFLKRSALGAGAISITASYDAADTSAHAGKFDPFERVSLGKSGLKMSRVIMGTGVRGGNRQSNHTRMGKENCEALMRSAYERGVRGYDLADMYGTHPFRGLRA